MTLKEIFPKDVRIENRLIIVNAGPYLDDQIVAGQFTAQLKQILTAHHPNMQVSLARLVARAKTVQS